MKLTLESSRRLTGANLYGDATGAVIDVLVDGPGISREQLIQAWQSAVDHLLEAAGQPRLGTTHRLFDGGMSLVVHAAIDQLYAMCELNEVAWALAAHECGAGPAPDLPAELARLRQEFDAEKEPALIALPAAAEQKGVPFLWDGEAVSLGYGRHGRTWSRQALPSVKSIDWAPLKSIPLALVTGTNGKSTTVRMTAAIMNASGVNAGLTSTDFIRVGDRIVEHGDYSGGEGARLLLRRPEVDMAVLEVARGGMLRRGLPIARADAALITNIAADHLGEYGIRDVADLTEAKFIIRRALPVGAPLILNADDERLVQHAAVLEKSESLRTGWFSLDASHPLIREGIARKHGVCWLEDGSIFTNAVLGSGMEVRKLTSLEDIPATHGGLVRHNIQNAMGAALLALGLGLSDENIREGLAAFRGDESDNPGRANWFEHEGVRILVDFAHNEHGLAALAASVNAMRVNANGAGRVLLMIGQAGDRSDEAVRGYLRAGCAMNPSRLLLCRMPGYERGREPDDVPKLMRDEALALGMPDANIALYREPRAAARDALQNARSGDVLVLLALTQREDVLRMVHSYVDGPGDRPGDGYR